MRALYLMRHAKSSWKDPRLVDHERPLNKRGKKDAPEMGRRLRARGAVLDVIVTSDARRAVDTAIAMADGLGLLRKAIRTNAKLYHAAPDQVLEVVRQLDDNWPQVLLVGHNPGLTELVNRLYPDPIANVPTAGIVVLGFDTQSWRQIDRDRLAVSSFDFPKNTSPC